MPSADELPSGLSSGHVELDRAHGRVARLVLIGLLAAIVLGAAFGLVGQRPSTTVAASEPAELTVYSPSKLRGGLLFTTRFEIRARKPLRAATLALDSGWFEGMQVNSIVPQPRSESSRDGRVLLHIGPVAAGERVVTFVQFQVDPTNVGHRSQDVRLFDGSRQLVEIRRQVTVFP